MAKLSDYKIGDVYSTSEGIGTYLGGTSEDEFYKKIDEINIPTYKPKYEKDRYGNFLDPNHPGKIMIFDVSRESWVEKIC